MNTVNRLTEMSRGKGAVTGVLWLGGNRRYSVALAVRHSLTDSVVYTQCVINTGTPNFHGAKFS